ncbi:hypothetical protein WJX84_004994 [Apatococcus fuscideae]|uniref:RRM domain-containing protein n=1 Tax=Apatococcus fuscideae TaxID=2026836 RepID=A0AAW1T2C2_9CHLO
MRNPSWYYLDSSGQATGPYLPEGLAGLVSSGHVTSDTYCWAEGQDNWRALKEIPELRQAAVVPLPQENEGAAAPAAGQMQSTASAAQDFAAAASSSASGLAASRAAVVAQPARIAAKPKAAAAPAAAAAAPSKPAEEVDPELAAFAAEITAIDPEALQGTAEARASTPSPNEQRFVDDDGTAYVWDTAQRKFLPKGQAGAAAHPDYNQEDMTFVADEEKIPVYDPPDPLAEVEGAEDLAVDPDTGAPAAAAGRAPGQPAPAEMQDAGSNPSTSGWAADAGGASDADREMQPVLGPGAMNGAGSKRDAAEAVLEKRKEKAKKAKEAAEAAQPKAWFDLKINTSVYVTGLPDDVTEMELAQVFTKCGILKEDDDRKPKVKVYRDRQSQVPKGDGLVTYLKEPSLPVALLQ